MRIAFISFEFPPAVAIGGIGTYALEAVKMLASAGQQIEVFCAGRNTPEREYLKHPNVTVHRIDVMDRRSFGRAIKSRFHLRHEKNPFDVLESPEIGCEGAIVAELHPEIGRVVKLHTPSFLVAENSWELPSWGQRVRFFAGALRRGRMQFLSTKFRYDVRNDPEARWCRAADEIASPSDEIGKVLAQEWSLAQDRLSVFPYPFVPSLELLKIQPIEKLTTVGFLGRLEPRKGVLELCAAIPQVLKHCPKIRFLFIGPSWPYRNTDMETWIKHQLGEHRKNIDFTGPINHRELHEEISKVDVACLPSRWESFGLVCAESMAAARVVVGSSAGGMADMIAHGETGLLVPPRNPKAIAEAILKIVRNPANAIDMATAGRQSIQELLSPERIYPLQMASYRRAIERARLRSKSLAN